MSTTILAAGGGIVMPDDDVLRGLLRLLGVFMWFITAGLIAAAIRAGVEIAAQFDEGNRTGPGVRRLVVIAVAAILLSSATTWAGWLLI
ncbi:hypothetical protein GS504_03455 [Rhodococcus hoagii]|nr:hypothetical protein [Prescottella equi]NKS56613.1 hypothetical protein [Prescottella equi]